MKVTCITYCLIIFACLGVHSYSAAQTNPMQLYGLQAWWSADSLKVGNGNPVETWTTNNNEFLFVTQPTAANRPTLVDNVLNGKPVVRFDGVNDYLNGGDILDIGSSGKTLIILGNSHKSNGTFCTKSHLDFLPNRYSIKFSGGDLYFIYHDINRYYISTSSAALSEYNIITSCVENIKGLGQIFVNGPNQKTLNIQKNYNMNSSFEFYIGAFNHTTGSAPYPGFYLDGDIAEIIIYNRPLSQLERQDIENYLRMKYFPGTERLQFSLGADIVEPYSLAPITLTVPPKPYYVSYEWNTGATAPSIVADTAGTYIVYATDDWGYEYYDTIHIDKPSLHYPNSYNYCYGDTLVWDCGIHGNYTYTWNTGAHTPDITITESGNYWLHISDTFGNSIESAHITVTFDDFTQFATIGSDTTMCAGNVLSLQQRADEALSYLWSTGSNKAAISISESGEYWLKATNAAGCTLYDTVYVSITGVAPQVDFTVEYICIGDSTLLSSRAKSVDENAITHYQWLLGTDTITEKDTYYTFNSVGTHTVEHVATTSSGCIHSLKKSIEIFPLPIVDFTPPKTCQYATTLFESTSTVSKGELQSYMWNIEGEVFTGSDVEYAFTHDSTVAVTLTAITTNACQQSTTKFVEVREGPKVDFVYSTPCKGDAVYVFDKTEFAHHNAMVEGSWTIQGEKFEYAPTITALFNDTLTHTISLTCKTVNGCTISATKNIHVNPKPEAIVAPLFACVDQEITLSHQSNAYAKNIAEFEWIVADKQYNTPAPVVQFADTGAYSIELRITTEEGCTHSTYSTIIIEQTPKAQFSFYPEFGAVPITVEFTNTSEHASHYTWVFAKHDTIREEHPQYEFTEKNNASAQFYAYSPHGCVDSAIAFIPIYISEQSIKIIDFAVRRNSKGYMEYEIQVANMGNTTVNLIEFVMEHPEFPPIVETWQGRLDVQKTMSYTFNAQTLSADLPPYICAQARLTPAHEYVIYFTDSACISLQDYFEFYMLSPSVAQQFITLRYNVPQATQSTISIYDSHAQLVEQQTITHYQQGVQTTKYDVQHLAPGIYSCVITYNGTRKVKTFAKE